MARSRPSLPFLSLLLLLVSPAHAFLFTYTSPTSCDPLTILWSGGTPSFNLLITLVHSVAQNISVPSSAFSLSTNEGNYTLPKLALPPGQKFLITMSDSTGFGTGGTSDQLTVGPSATGANCDTSTPQASFFFFLPQIAEQCKAFEITWQPNATLPVDIWGVMPLGQAFQLHPTTAALSFNWTVNIPTGTSFVLGLTDAQGRQGGTSVLWSVSPSDDDSCINGNSPSTTLSSDPALTSVLSGPTSSPSSVGSSSGGTTNLGSIIGGVVAGVVALVCLGLALWFLSRGKKRQTIYGSTGRDEQGGMIDLLPNPFEGGTGRQDGGVDDSAEGGRELYQPVPFLTPSLGGSSVDGSQGEGQGWRGDPFTDRHQAPSSQRSSTAATSTISDTSARLLPGSAKRAEARRGAHSSSGGSQDWSTTGSDYTETERGGGRRYVMHTDGGSVPDSEDPPEEGEEIVVELPPAYDPSLTSRTTGTPRTGTTGLSMTSPSGGGVRQGMLEAEVSGETLKGGVASTSTSGWSTGKDEIGERH